MSLFSMMRNIQLVIAQVSGMSTAGKHSQDKMQMKKVACHVMYLPRLAVSAWSCGCLLHNPTLNFLSELKR